MIPPPEDSPAPAGIAVLVRAYPELSQTFVAQEVRALRRLGHEVGVEARIRGARSTDDAAVDVRVVAEESRLAKARDLTWLLARHPAGCVRDLRSRARWRREEEPEPFRRLAGRARRLARSGAHLHVHFADEVALDALRIGRLIGRPYSLTAHAYDIFQKPRNLREKVVGSAFTTTGAEVNVQHLRTIAGPEHAARISEVVMGVDGEVLRRRPPYPGGRSVLAIGRLVEKKGFGTLLDAVTHVHAEEPLDAVTIVGDGPLRPSLAVRARALGLDGVVVLAGAEPPDRVRERLEAADVLVMPSVVAADGDRDSMPVVVKEALAMEVPVVTSDAVGLPELVRPGWGRLARAGDADSLAAELAGLLALPAGERAAMGRAGRAHVLAHADLTTESARLSGLIEATRIAFAA